MFRNPSVHSAAEVEVRWILIQYLDFQFQPPFVVLPVSHIFINQAPT